MAIWKVFKLSRKTFFNPTAWLGTDSIKESNRAIVKSLKSTIPAQTPAKEETFEQAMQRFKLSEEDVGFKIKRFRQFSLIFALIGLLIFLYAFFLLFRYVTFTGFLLGVASAALLWSQAFRFDFWALQFEKRQLGLSFDDWKKHILGGKEGSS